MKIKTLHFHWKLVPIFLCMFTATFAQTRSEKQQITSSYNQNYLQQLQTEYAQKAKNAKQKAVAMAKVNGWDTIKIKADGTVVELMAVTDDGQPLYYTTYNVNAAKSTRVNHLNEGGSLGLNLNGQNMTAYVWDGGAVRTTHQEFDGPGGTNRVTINDGSTTAIDHATHVTGTILASGYVAAAKGMAPYAKALTHEWNNDLGEATAEAAKGMLVSNHSYGFYAPLIPDWYFGAYIDESTGWDNLMYNSPYYLMVAAAGNDGQDNSSNGAPLDGNTSYDKLSGHATCKNNMVVACGDDANVNADGSLNSVTIAYFSSQGPTDDYRIKPDITGNGRDVYSSISTGDDQYGSMSGTSMASPNVTGTLLILQQYYKQVNGSFMRAASLKGLALHTADDAGNTGPDPIYGWGLLNAKAAAGVIANNDNSSILRELSLTSGQTYTITVQSNGTSPLKASISWTDPAGTANTGTANLKTPVLVNDLDIRVTQGSTSYNPWRLTGVTTNGTGDNVVDPFERVDINNASGTYTITVRHKGSLSGGSQNFTLVVTGLGSSTNIPVTGVTISPNSLSLSPGQTSTLTAVISPSNATNKNVTWASNNTGVATVSSSGVVTAIAAGSATITVTTVDGGKTATCTVQVSSAGYCTSKGKDSYFMYTKGVTIGSFSNTSGASGYTDFTGKSVSLVPGTSYSITLEPGYASTSYYVIWRIWIDFNQNNSFDDAQELVFTSQAGYTATGSITIPASATRGITRMRVSMKYYYPAAPASCETFDYGEVEDYSANITGTTVPVTGVTISPSSLSLPIGSTYTLTATVLPSNATNKNVTWTWEGLGVITFIDFGVIKAIKTGSETITVITEDGNKRASCTVTVTSSSVTYCTPVVTGSNQWIGQVKTGSINNATSIGTGYSDYTNLSTNMALGMAQSINLVTGWATSSSKWIVWIDFNKDGDFTDSGEEVVNNTFNNSNITTSFTVPSTASLGTTRMRVMMVNTTGTVTPCSLGDGEVEDYSVNITASGITAETDTTNSVTGLNETVPDMSVFSVYPSPAQNRLYFNSKDGGSITSVKIINSFGKLIESKDNVKEMSLDVSNLPGGVYFIKVKINNKEFIRKFIKE